LEQIGDAERPANCGPESQIERRGGPLELKIEAKASASR